MTILYVTDQGAQLTRRGNRLVVEKAGRQIHWIQSFKVEQVIIMGNVSLTPSTVAFLLDEGVDTVYLTYHGRFRGRLLSRLGKNIELRRVQFRKMEDPQARLGYARLYVRGKLDNCRVLMRRQNRRVSSSEVTAGIHGLRRLAARLDFCEGVDVLMGVEGSGAAAYFKAFGRLIRVPDFTFEGRNRRPPRDPVNVLLSLGYTLLANAVHTQVNITGLDPYLGSLHGVEYGRPSLVLDLMEEFRPVLVDALVLSVINRKIIKHTDFYRPEEREPAAFDFAETEPVRENYPIYLTHEGMKKFVTRFEARLNQRVTYLPLGRRLTYRGIILEQVRLFARSLAGEGDYRPFSMR